MLDLLGAYQRGRSYLTMSQLQKERMENQFIQQGPRSTLGPQHFTLADSKENLGNLFIYQARGV